MYENDIAYKKQLRRVSGAEEGEYRDTKNVFKKQLRRVSGAEVVQK